MNLPQVTHTHTHPRRSASQQAASWSASIGHVDLDRWNIEAALFVVSSLNCYSHRKKKPSHPIALFLGDQIYNSTTDSSVQIACPKIMQLWWLVDVKLEHHIMAIFKHLMKKNTSRMKGYWGHALYGCDNGPFPKNFFLFACDTLGAQ